MDLLCEKEDCDNEATFRYRWPWGDEGVVCDYHATTTQQLATQLGREPALVSLGQPTAPAPDPASTSDLLEQLRTAHAELEHTQSELELAQRRIVELSHELGALKRRPVEPTSTA